MYNSTKNKIFETLIFKQFGQDNNYDRLRHNILNIRETMSENHKSFRTLSAQRQLDYCSAIGVIAVHTQLQHMNENRPLSKPENNRYSHSIDRGWNGITVFEVVQEQEILKIEN
jgi:hypothetical protein